MTNPLGVDDFFVLESGEYLERLTALVGRGTPPVPDELVRYTRALRGSALMASQSAIARAAGGLESLARSFRDGRTAWDPDVSQLAVRSVGQIKQLVAHVGHWSDGDTAAAERLAHELEAVSRGAAPIPAEDRAPASGPHAGVRAFVAREGAMVASALDQAAHALHTTPNYLDALQAVIKRMQPLRGLAALADFPPIPDLLEGVERAVTELNHGTVGSDFVGQLFEAGAKALSRAARDVAQSGRPDPDAEESRRFADLLIRADADADTVVPIESLFFDDGMPGVVRRGTAPRPAAPPLGRAELVSRGEHLCQVADDLDRATSPTQRDLRLHSLTTDLRSLGESVLGQLGTRIRAFADQARDAISRGVAARAVGDFAACLREAGQLLRAWSEEASEGPMIEQFAGLSRTLTHLDAVISQPATIAPPAPPVPTAELDLDIVPIESLLLEEPPAPPPTGVEGPVGARAESRTSAVESTDLAGSLVTYARLLQHHGLPPASLDELLRRPTQPKIPIAPAPAEVSTGPVLEPVPERPLAPVAATPEPEVIEIGDLCYRGRGALLRAALVKLQIRGALASRAPASTVDPLIDELLDLVELALVDE